MGLERHTCNQKKKKGGYGLLGLRSLELDHIISQKLDYSSFALNYCNYDENFEAWPVAFATLASEDRFEIVFKILNGNNTIQRIYQSMITKQAQVQDTILCSLNDLLTSSLLTGDAHTPPPLFELRLDDKYQFSSPSGCWLFDNIGKNLLVNSIGSSSSSSNSSKNSSRSSVLVCTSELLTSFDKMQEAITYLLSHEFKVSMSKGGKKGGEEGGSYHIIVVIL